MISKKVDYRKRKTNETFFGMPFLPLAIFLVLVLVLLILPPQNFVSEQNKITGKVISDITLTTTKYVGNENLAGNLNLIFNRGDRIPQYSLVEFKITALPSPIIIKCPSYYVCEDKSTVPEQVYNSASHVCEDAGIWTYGPWEDCGDADYNDLYDCSTIGKKCCSPGAGSGAFYTNAQCSSGECRDICSGTVTNVSITLSDAISRSTTPTKGNLTSGAFRNVNGPSPSGSGYGFGACGNVIREPAKQVTGLAVIATPCDDYKGICINPEFEQCPLNYILSDSISCNSVISKCCVPQLPDLTVLSIDYYSSSPEQPGIESIQPVGELQATIDNIGNVAAQNAFSVVACLYDPSQIDNPQTFGASQPPGLLPPNCFYATTNPITPPVPCSSVGGTCIPNTAGCTGRVDDTKACQSNYYCCIPMNQQPPGQVTGLAIIQPPIQPPVAHPWPGKITVSFGNRNVANKVVKVTVDYNHQVTESDETNNQYSRTFAPLPTYTCVAQGGLCYNSDAECPSGYTDDFTKTCQNGLVERCCMRYQPPTPTCNDTDNGYNIYVKGTCKDNNPLPFERTDNCQAATQLQEYWCSAPLTPGSEESCISEVVACPYGCVDGACKQAPVTNYTCERDGGTCIDDMPPYQCSGYIDTGKTCGPMKICCMPGAPPVNYSCSGWNNMYAINLNQINLKAPAAAGNYSLNVSVTYYNMIDPPVVMTWDDVKFSVTGTTHKKCVNYKCVYVPGPGSNSCSSNSNCNRSGGGGGGCTEDWTCYPWGSCVNGQRTRSCTDNNTCGTYSQRPSLWEVCQSGCLGNWQCSDWTFCQQGTQQQSQRCEDMNRCDTVNYSYTQTRDCCVEEWDCKWSLCSSGVSTKVCTDKNNCGTEFTKPASETKKCTASFFTILGPWTWLILIVLVLAILTILFATKVIPWPFKPGAKKPESGGSYPELNSYIKNAQSSGESRDAIRKKLVEAGWPKDVVDDSLKNAKK